MPQLGFVTMSPRPWDPEERTRLEAIEGLLAHLGRYNQATLQFELSWPTLSVDHLRMVVAELVRDPASQTLLHPDDRPPEG